MVATGDLKSPAVKACRFDSGPGHQIQGSVANVGLRATLIKS